MYSDYLDIDICELLKICHISFQEGFKGNVNIAVKPKMIKEFTEKIGNDQMN